jgi:hypothetical protein
MESAVVIILIICTVLVICIVIGAVFFYNKKRTLAFKELANELGMRFEASESGVLPICRELELFQRGHSKVRKNILSNEGSDTSMSIFGYYYTTGSGDSSSRTAQTVFLVHSQHFDLPSMHVRPERWFHKVGSLMGHQDIDFEDDSDFSRQWLVRGDNETLVRNYLTRTRRDLLQSKSDACLETHGKVLIFYRKGKRISVSDTRRFIEEGIEICKVFAED